VLVRLGQRLHGRPLRERLDVAGDLLCRCSEVGFRRDVVPPEDRVRPVPGDRHGDVLRDAGAHQVPHTRAVGTEGENDEGTPLRWTRGVVQRRVKASAPLGPVAIRYAGLGEELLLQAHEVSEDDGRALLNGGGVNADLGERLMGIVATSGPISGNAIERYLKGQGIGVQRSAFFETLRQLVDAGRVQQTSAGYALAGAVPEVVPAVPGTRGARELEVPVEPTES
jgi:hypothetical protein